VIWQELALVGIAEPCHGKARFAEIVEPLFSPLETGISQELELVWIAAQFRGKGHFVAF